MSCCTPGSSRGGNSSDAAAVPGPTWRQNTTATASGETVQVPVPLAAGEFDMGDNFGEGYPADGETPVHRVALSAFLVDPTAVTNGEFAAFVDATGYVTDAERYGSSAVFHLALDPSDTAICGWAAHARWWLEVRGACWHRPEGPRSDIEGRRDHPVVHVSHRDALAYCAWALQASPHRSGVGVRRTGRPRSSPLPVGRRPGAAWECISATSGTGGFPSTTRLRTATSPPLPRRASIAMTTACGAWSATSGSGAPTGSRPTTTGDLPSKIPGAPRSAWPGSCAVGPTCATTPTATDTAWRRDRATHRIPRRATSAFGALPTIHPSRSATLRHRNSHRVFC